MIAEIGLTFSEGVFITGIPGEERQNARLVGRILSKAHLYGEYPCHRVVNSTGRLVPGWTEQRELLRQEGVMLKDDAHVDLKKYRWQPGES